MANVSKAKREYHTVLDQMRGPSRYPKGTRIEITRISAADQAYVPLEKGDQGTVCGGNDLQLWVEFYKGVSVTVVNDVDHYKVISEQEEKKAS